MSTPDFDILGQINIQLAKDAGAKLSKELEKTLAKDFTVNPTIEPIIKATGLANKIFVDKKVVQRKVSLKVSNAVTFKKYFEDKVVNVDINISPATLASFDKLNDALAKIDKTVGGLDKLAGIGAAIKATAGAVNINNAKKAAKGPTDTIFQLIQDIKKLSAEAQKQSGVPNAFF